MKSSPPPNPPNRGFTLVEILVAITVIAILAGMLIVGVFPALNRAKETAIQVELSTLERAVEDFKLKFGVYPPSFTRIRSAQNPPNQMLVELNRINRNHREGDIAPGQGKSYIELWWEQVGQFIRPEEGEDLVFWLSGLCKNRQFPLTNGLQTGVVPSAFENDADGIEREIFANFKKKQLIIVGSPARAGYSQTPNLAAPFLYIDAGSYLPALVNPQVPRIAPYWRWIDPPNSITDSIPTLDQINNRAVIFENAKTFQLVAPGINNLTGGTGGDDFRMGGNVLRYSLQDADNFANFAEGRLGEYADASAGK
jgi:prepilin-type N-terminal cleavage/methylation domain-containing protein